MDERSSNKRQGSQAGRSAKSKSKASQKQDIPNSSQPSIANNDKQQNQPNFESLEVQHKFTIEEVSFIDEFPIRNWDTAYIDGKYYLSDPDALARLRALDAEIEAEKEKLAYIDDTDQFNKSFLSHQVADQEDPNNRNDCLTQINQSRLYARKQEAEQDLLNEEQKYRAKIEGMKRKRSIMKKEIGCGTQDNDKFIQAQEKQIASQVQKKQRQQVKSKKQDSKKEKSQRVNSVKKSQKQATEIQKLPSENKQQASSKKVPSVAKSQKKSFANEENEKNQQQKAPSDKKSASKCPSKKSSRKSVEKQESQNKEKVPSIKGSVKSNSIKKDIHEKEESHSKSKVQKSQQGSRVQKYEQQLLNKPISSPSKKESIEDKNLQERSVHESQKPSIKNSQKSVPKSDAKQIIQTQQKLQASPSRKSSQNKGKTEQISEKGHQPEKSIKQSHKGENRKSSVKHSQKPKQSQKSMRSERISVKDSQKKQKQHVQQAQKSVRSNKSRSKKSQLLQHIERSKKSASINEIEGSSKNKSQVPIQNRSEVVDRLTQRSKLSEKPKSNKKQFLQVPQIQIHSNSFKKTDKSVQWEQNEPSQSKHSQKQKSISKVSQSKPVASRVNYAQQYESAFINPRDIQETQHNQTTQLVNDPSQLDNTQQVNEAQQVDDSKSSVHENSQNQSQIMRQGDITQQYQNQNMSSQQSSVSMRRSQGTNLGKQSKVSSSFEQKFQAVVAPSEEEHIERNFVKKNYQPQKQNSQFLKQSERSEKSGVNISQSQLVSQKKQRSFIIHSKQHSVKSKKSHSRHSRNPSREKSKRDSFNQSRTSQKKDAMNRSGISEKDQGQISRLQQQILQLQQKLKIVEEKQEKIIKYQEKQTKQLQQSQYDNETSSPLGKFTMTSRLQLQKRLSLEGSIIQFNVMEEKNKISPEEQEKLQKLRLQEEIGRLKKIIREMQLQKIMSIENDPQTIGSRVQFKKQGEGYDSRFQSRSRLAEKFKQSLNTDMLETRKDYYQSQTVNKEEAGRIVKNSPMKSLNQTPRVFNRVNAQKIKQFSEMAKDQEGDYEHEPLPLRKKIESTPPQRHRNDLTKSELLEKCDRNEKQFHQFLESSRLVQEPESIIEHNNLNNISMPDAFAQHTKTQNYFDHRKVQKVPEPKKEQPSQMKRNFSQIMQKMKNQNPEDEDIRCQQIKINDINFPDLPDTPNLTMSQDDLLELARKTFSIFGIDIDQDQNQLCMKKYKNCVVFSLNGNPDSILWHYSGKFYLGGWKNSDAGEGQKTGQGLQCFPAKHIYKGQFMGGKKNGNGIVKLQNGNIYEGQWVDGVKSGRGVYFEASTGTYYSGQWKDGKRDGYGILKFSQLEFYEGTFVKSVKHGYGVERFANGDFYRGEYQRGKFHGKGRYVWANGSSYEGNFMEGCRHGQGNWKSSRSGGDIYIGAYESDKKCGYGRYVWANGCIYEGQFRGDLKNGKGRLIYQDGKQIKGVWQNGTLISNDNERKIPEHEESPLRRSIRASSFRGNQNSFYNQGY